MDANTAGVIGLAFLALCTVAVSLVVAMSRGQRSNHTTHVTAGDNSQVNVNGETQATNGTYTQIRVYEDLMALIAQNKDLLAILRDVLQAVKEGRTDELPTQTLDEIMAEIERGLHMMATTAATGREAESRILKQRRYGANGNSE